MPIPACDDYGFLPAGIHDCTLDEVEGAFCGSDQRRALFGQLRAYVDEWRNAGMPTALYLDGGFTTHKPEEPKDIDLAVDLEPLDLRDAAVLDVVNRLLNHDVIQAQYGIEVFPFHRTLVANDFRLWFGYVRPEKRRQLGLPDEFRKGILRVQL